MNHLTSDQDNNQPVKHNPDEIVTSWRDLDTSTPEGLRELNAVIARRRGFQVVELNSIHPVFRWILVDANGQLYYECKPHFEGFNTRRSAKEAFEMDAPAYTTDANAALALAYNTDCKITLETTRDPYTGKRIWLADIDTISYVETCTADTPALAVCLAFLAYTDAQAAAAGGKREAGE